MGSAAKRSSREPTDAIRCEACGYPLAGLDPEGACPECGEPIAASDPERRDGPPWEHRATAASWCSTAWTILRRPGRAFRELRVTGSAVRARVYVLSIAVACWLNPATVVGLIAGDPRWAAAGLFAVKLVLALTYLEALGLVVIGRQRGWRLPFAHAERVVAYAATGWLIGLPVAWCLGVAFVVATARGGGWPMLDLPVIGAVDPPPGFWLAAGAIAFALIAMPFELLAYLGARRCRFANRRPSMTH